MKNSLLMQISTHWDREWYLPFQEFRWHLVEMTDTLLDSLENGSLPEFVFDGQTIVIEDYLEIRPENRERIAKLIKDGKLKIGPWYCMPDEFSVSGESLIENFLVGQNISRSYGVEPWRFGYVNDVFGHIAQFPQILNGFGINGVYLGRGVDSKLPNGSHFLWVAPNGSKCFAYKDVYANPKRDFTKSENPTAFLRDYIGKRSNGYPVLLNYTDDHGVIDENTFKFLQALESEKLEVSGGFEKLGELMAAHSDELVKIEGELSATAYQPSDFRVVTNSISSYYPLKKRNDSTEHLLYRETAPLLVMSEMAGLLENKRRFFDLARKYLLKNQPHDSICGCSVDAVHRDMPYRYAQAEEIADIIRCSFKNSVTKRLEKSDNLKLLVLNTDLHSRNGVINVTIDFPRDFKGVFSDNTGYERYNMFSIINANGIEVPYQILKVEQNFELYDRQNTVLANRCTVALTAEIDSFGITEFEIVPSKMRKLTPPTTAKGRLFAENEFISLAIGSMGEVNVTDKVRGRVYTDLLNFVDDADSGNGWFHGNVNFDSPAIVSKGAEKIEVLSYGPLVWSFRVTKRLAIPTEIVRSEYRRSDTTAECEIATTITLKSGQRYLEFETTVDNNSAEHRLRLQLPSGIVGNDYSASQAFCFIKRERGVSEEGLNGRESEYVEKNTSGIIDLDGEFAFVGAEGLHEAGVYPDGTVSVTLFRSVGKMFHQPKTEYARLLEKMSFKYAIAFGTPKYELLHIKDYLQSSPEALTVTGKSAELHRLMELTDRRISVSTVKPSEDGDGWIARMYNPTDKAVKCELFVSERFGLTAAELSERESDSPKYRGTIPLEFSPYTIISVRIN